MYCLIDFCCICFDNKDYLQPLSNYDSNNVTYFIKLTSCVPEMCLNEMIHQSLVCNKCCEIIDAAYKFRQRCLRSKATLTDYISQLHQVSNINEAVNVYCNDINKFLDVKEEYQKENNTNKAEMFIDVDEQKKIGSHPITEIKRDNNPVNLTLIETGHNFIQLENIVTKKEQNTPNSEEHVEKSSDNLLVNQNEIKIDVSGNDINFTASAIKKENENKDFEEHLHKKIDIILEMRNNENNIFQTKVEENLDYSLYSEKCAVDPLINLDEIKIDIIDNHIEPINSKLKNEHKSEDIEFSRKDQVIASEDDYEKDKDTSSSFATMKETPKDKSSKSEDMGNSPMKNNPEGIKLKCNICEKKYKSLSTLRNHMRIHTGEKLYECSVCQHKFTRSSNLRRHMQIHTKEKPHECSVCHKKFTTAFNLRKHMNIHTGAKPHECNVCQKKFNHLSNLKKHIRIHTGEKPHECSVCQKKFNQSSNLNEHMQIHDEEKRHKCGVCQKKFNSLNTLKRHMRIHTGEKPYECRVCQKKFIQSSTLIHHMRIHTGVKPYECSVCQMKFSQLSNMNEHMKIHTGEKPHECSVCHKRFLRSSALIKHMRIHTGENLYECSVCQKKFIQLTILRKHMILHT